MQTMCFRRSAPWLRRIRYSALAAMDFALAQRLPVRRNLPVEWNCLGPPHPHPVSHSDLMGLVPQVRNLPEMPIALRPATWDCLGWRCLEALPKEKPVDLDAMQAGQLQLASTRAERLIEWGRSASHCDAKRTNPLLLITHKARTRRARLERTTILVLEDQDQSE